ncbi:MAG: hypothetical protein L0211_27155 [Planctomycetaceae bacterium]|nr:hypothetical protein [Planctomycetaceae bacterium]
MHRIFAISGVVLTIATIWMFYKDHARPWKLIQPKVVDIDLKMNAWRREQFDTNDALLTHERLSQDLAAAKAQPIDSELLGKYKGELQKDAKARELTVSTDWIDEAAKALEPLAAKAAKLRAAASEARRLADAKPTDKDLHLAAVKADAEALAAEQKAAAHRDRLLARLKSIVADAKIREDKALQARKFKSAEIDAAKASLDIAIRDNLGADEIARREKKVQELVGFEGDRNSDSFTSLNLAYQAYSAHRKALDRLVKEMTAEVDKAQKKHDDSLAALERLETQYQQQAETWFTLSSKYPFFLGKKWLTLPILDAFGSPRRIDNIWSEDLEHEYGSFGTVRRFDRCTTCHQSLVKAGPSGPTDPAYVAERTVNVVVTPPTGDQIPKPRFDDKGNEIPPTTEDWLGIRLAGKGLLVDDDVTVSLVLPRSPAARAEIAQPVAQDVEVAGYPGRELRAKVAQFTGEHVADDYPLLPGLVVGDVIEGINGSLLQGGDRGPKRVAALLLTLAEEGKPFTLRLRRGLPNPYISHPRLDLYCSDSSPHPQGPGEGAFGCTACHDGQGSATEFKFASHSPNTQRQAERWMDKYGWFDNHHWIFPMNPKRFAESSCLKCHHEVVELESSEKYPEAPAPKVVHGYQLIRKYGCFGCHEINGFDGPTRRVGPDLRTEPNYFAAAQALLPLLPARQAYLETTLLARLNESIAPAEAEVKQLGEQRAALEERKSQIDQSAADKDAQTKAVDDELAQLALLEKPAQDKLASLRRDLTAAQAHLDRIAETARLASQLAARPEQDGVRRRLQGILDEDVRIATENKDKPLAQHEWTTFDAGIQAMAGWFKDQEAPGNQRKPGPSLRYLAAKVDRTFLYDWLRDPTHFRETTRMPKFFGLWNHLKNAQGQMSDGHAPKLEPIEIRGTLEFLMAQSRAQLDGAQWPARNGTSVESLVQLYKPLPREAGIDPWTDEEKVARGKMQFQTRGCLACHTHKDFPEVALYRKPEEIVQGPDLSAVGNKFSADRNPQGPDWLYSWIKEPTRYHTRTVMPDLFLDPEKDPGADPLNPADDKWFDPADDIASYLLSSKSDWQPVPEAAQAGEPLDETADRALEQLTLEYLNEAFYKEAAIDYYINGIPPDLESELKGAEKDLIVNPKKKPSKEEWQLQKLRYIGRKSIAKYGCFGCHDIPGFEDAKPIGTGLADWGRKDPARLAFEHITHYVGEHGHGGGHAAGGYGDSGTTHANHGAKAKVDTETAETEEYFQHALEAGNRIGFIQQKLKEPRSYDFEKTENKRYNERLRMPQFPFTLEEREALITFVLGLVADPPREKYVFTPNPRTDALITGRQVLEKYNCGGCHILGLEKWRVSYPPGTYGPQSPPGQPIAVYPFLRPQVSPKDIRTQAVPDHRNLLHSTLAGLPKLAQRDGLPEVFDPENSSLTDEDPYLPSELRLSIDLYQPAIVDGDVYLTGISPLRASVGQIESRQPAWGGVLARYLAPEATRLEKQFNSNASGAEAYGWLPPPLIGEGNKVQSAWLHDFLLEPYPIRPATFLRMPKFNMTSDEATSLANYFAAVDNANFPHELSTQRLESELAAKARDYGRALDQAGVSAPDGQSWSKQPIDSLIDRRFDDAMQIVVDGNYCVKCHKVGDFQPTGRDRAKAPQLTEVYRRLKPDFLRRWIAKPNSILPYTSMPENVKYEPEKPFQGGVSQNLYHGTSTEQVDALVDLLMNYDTYARRGRRVAEMVKPATVPAEGTTPAESTAPAEGTAPATGAPSATGEAPAAGTSPPAATGSQGE